jgi:imidazolonepropionase-like amidohydrolase
MVAGTDSLAGLMLHRELALFVRAGIKPADALRMATLDPARVLGKDKVSGSIEKGKVADLVIVDGDPLARIDDLGKVVTTVKAGVVHDAAALYAAVGVKPL